MEAADWGDFAGFFAFGIRKPFEVELFEVEFSPTFDFAAKSAARGIEEELALAANLLLPMGLIAGETQNISGSESKCHIQGRYSRPIEK